MVTCPRMPWQHMAPEMRNRYRQKRCQCDVGRPACHIGWLPTSEAFDCRLEHRSHVTLMDGGLTWLFVEGVGGGKRAGIEPACAPQGCCLTTELPFRGTLPLRVPPTSVEFLSFFLFLSHSVSVSVSLNISLTLSLSLSLSNRPFHACHTCARNSFHDLLICRRIRRSSVI